MWLKKYLLNRATSVTAWIGALGFLLEFILHLGDVSLIMLMLFVVLIVQPEDRIRAVFADWTKAIKDELDKP